MPDTTTAVNACNVSIKLDDHTGVLKDISGSSNKIEPEYTQETGEYRVFQQGWFKRLQCGRDAAFTLSAVYSTLKIEALSILADWFFHYPGTHRTMEIYIPDDSIGSDKYSGEVMLASFSTPADTAEPGPIPVEATLLPDGEWTLTSVAS